MAASEMISKEFFKHKAAAVFADIPVENDLSAGITGGFPVVGYKGKTWSIRKRGEEELLMRPDGDGPRGSIDVVILSSAKVLSKTWYESGYVEGNSAPPDCWSGNGQVPSPQSPKIQSATCGTCPRNIWGGRITENGKRAKECADAKRMAVVFYDEIGEEGLEPALLRVPAASLADLMSYGNEVAKLGHHYFSVVTKISFDPEEAYPKFKFMATRPLNDAEGAAILEVRKDDSSVERILDETGDTVIDADGNVRPAQLPRPAPTAAIAKPAVKTINAAPATKPAGKVVTPKSKVTPRKAAVARAEETIEDATVVEEEAAANGGETAAEEEVEAAEDDDEAFDAALEAKLNAFLKS